MVLKGQGSGLDCSAGTYREINTDSAVKYAGAGRVRRDLSHRFALPHPDRQVACIKSSRNNASAVPCYTELYLATQSCTLLHREETRATKYRGGREGQSDGKVHGLRCCSRHSMNWRNTASRSASLLGAVRTCRVIYV